MFERLGSFSVRHRKAILWLTGLFTVVAGALGAGVADRLSSGGFSDPNAESIRAAEVLKERFGVSTPNFVLLITTSEGDVDDPDIEAQARAIQEELAAEPGVGDVLSYWDLDAPPLKSIDGDRALIAAVVEGDEDVAGERVEELAPLFEGREEGPLTVSVGGFAQVFHQVGTTIEKDLATAELIALPITMIAMIFVFGSVVSAALPLLVGGVAIVGAMWILSLINSMTQVSIFSLNLVTAMGLGLAIDYSLFIVSRYREELAAGLDPTDAVVRTVATAGRTVAFSGFTVALSLGALLMFPLAFLKSFAYAGVAVVLLASVAANVFLPALLAVLGPRVDKLRVRKSKPVVTGTEGFWHRAAMAVMRRPIILGTAVAAFLVVLGLPFLGVKFGLPDDRVLPSDASSHQVSQVIREEFPVDATNNLTVVAPDTGDPRTMLGAIDDYAAELSQIDGAFAVDGPTGTYVAGARAIPPTEAAGRYLGDDGFYLTVIPGVEAVSPEAEQLVQDLRAADSTFDVQVTGRSAELVDNKASIFDRVPFAALVIAGTSFVLLFLMFGGLLVPVKAILLNLLSLSATFGALVWIFQQGHLSETLDFTVTGTIDVTSPILMFCIAFGLSMDYEVFMLSRIKEEHDRTGDNTASVAMGLERTGRIVTAAALILSVVFLATAISSITFIKLFGIGLTLAVVVDATLVRAVLVPAFMRLAGEANWWAPKWMRRIQERVGLSEGEKVVTEGAAP